MARPVKIIESGGHPVVHVTGLDRATPGTPVDDPIPGWPITLVPDGQGYPMVLVNDDGTEWSDVENLLTFTEQFDNAAWANIRSSETGGQSDPFGGSDAFHLTEDSASGTHYIQQAIVHSDASVYTLSLYVKDDGSGRNVRIFLNAASNPWATFDSTDGSFVEDSASPDSHGSEQVGVTDWWRVWITSTNSAITQVRFYVVQAPATYSYAGDGSSGVLIYGAQLNEGGIKPYVSGAA